MGHNRKEIRKAGVSAISIFKQQRWVISLKQSLNFCSTLDTTSTRMAWSTSRTTRLSLRSSLVPLVSDPETTSTMRLSSIKRRFSRFLMDHADVDHDGKIDCGEFSNWATGVAAEIAASGTIPQHL